METLADKIIIPGKHNLFIQEINFSNAPVHQIATAMKTNSAFTGLSTKNPFWFQQFLFRQSRKH